MQSCIVPASLIGLWAVHLILSNDLYKVASLSCVVKEIIGEVQDPRKRGNWAEVFFRASWKYNTLLLKVNIEVFFNLLNALLMHLPFFHVADICCFFNFIW